MTVDSKSCRVSRDCVLSRGGLLAIAQFEKKYRSEVVREKRIAFVKSEILPTYFNYLLSQGQAPKTDRELMEKTKV